MTNFIDGAVKLSPNKVVDEYGNLHGKAIAAVPTTYEYMGNELNLDSLDPKKTYKVQKTESELRKSVDSYKNKFINFGNHLPDAFFTPNTDKNHYAGHIKNSRYIDGVGIEVDFVIHDKQVINHLLSNNNVEVSPAFSANIDTVNGQLHQTDIKINSLTIIDSTLGVEARGGSQCRVIDSKQTGDHMDPKENQNKLIDRLETENKELKAKLEVKEKSFADSKVTASKLETENKELKTENASLKEQIVDVEKNAFIKMVDSKLTFDDCKTDVDCKRKILTDSNYLNVDYSKQDPIAVDAYWNAFSDSQQSKTENANKSISNVNEELNSTFGDSNSLNGNAADDFYQKALKAKYNKGGK
ncbi:MAG: DUF2213 domain-containing protein [Mesoflavibacter sp.]|nr:DUF2213 domain-containing protein [Mesoflavibacter sp.]